MPRNSRTISTTIPITDNVVALILLYIPPGLAMSGACIEAGPVALAENESAEIFRISD